MNIHAITSPHNQRVKDAVKLRGRRQRARQGRTVIDGVARSRGRSARRARLVELFVCEPLCQSDGCRELLARLAGRRSQVWHVTPEVFERVAFGERPEGIVAVADLQRRALGQLRFPRAA